MSKRSNIPSLVHGTTNRHLTAILANGLLPRRLTGNNNYSDALQSKPSRVYLTSAYAPVFGLNAMADSETEQVVLIEVAPERLRQTGNLRPDEDYITLWKDAKKYPKTDLWRRSLLEMGVCSYQGSIPVREFRRVSVIEVPENVWCYWDAGISVMGHTFFGRYYQAWTRHCLGYPVQPQDFHNAVNAEWLPTENRPELSGEASIDAVLSITVRLVVNNTSDQLGPQVI